MWRYALLGTASLVAASNGGSNEQKNGNSSIPAVSSSLSLQRPASVEGTASPSNATTSYLSRSAVSNHPSSYVSGYSVPGASPSLKTTTIPEGQVQASSILTHASVPASSNAPSKPDGGLSNSMTSDLHTWTSRYPTGSPTIKTSTPSTAPYEFKNLTAVTFARGSCTGCALAALDPRTTAYNSDLFGNWTSLVVTETILTEFVTYLDGSTIDTVVTELKTVNQTKTVADITDTAAEFNIYLPTPGLELTLQVGPTYVLYTDFIGGLDAQIAAMAFNNATHNQLEPTQNICRPHVSSLRNWAPTRTEDWNYFIQTFNGSSPEQTAGDRPIPVPSKLVDFLAQDPDFQNQFQGADIKTCTVAGTTGVLIGDPSRTFQPDITTTETKTTAAASSSAPFFPTLPGTNTYLSTTYLSTSKHITKQGCLRCDTDPGELPKTSKPTEQDPNANKVNDDPVPTKSPNPKNDDNPKTDGNPQGQPQNTPQNTPKPDVKTTPSVPDILESIISDNPNLTKNPQNQPTDSGGSITVGNSVVAVRPQPSQNGESAAPTVVVIGTQSLTVGQTTTINGVPVVVPTGGRGSTIIVGDKTIDISPRMTQAPLPVLTVGHNTITANSQGQFVIGAQTLQRGGPELTINGYTLTLGPNSKIAMWNSASATLINMAGPSAVPAVSFGEQLITAKVLGGTTVFILNDKTLAPGSAITIDGTTFSLPPGVHGSSVVVNGQTQRLKPGLPALTIDNSLVTATVADGTTEFVLAPGETLTPGGVIIISGTTYSLPTTGLGSTVVINGMTSRLNPSHLPVLPFSGEVVTATVAHGTTAFIFGPGETLTPGGMITVSGTTLSLPASGSGSVVVINGVTSTLMGSIISALPIVVDGKTITATTRDGTTEYVLNSATTLRPDGQIIIDGTTYSLAPGGTALIVNGKTSLISSTPASNSASVTSTGSTSETTSERGAGDFIASGIGETSKGAGSWAHGGAVDKWVESLVMGVAGWLLWLL